VNRPENGTSVSILDLVVLSDTSNVNNSTQKIWQFKKNFRFEVPRRLPEVPFRIREKQGEPTDLSNRHAHADAEMT